MVIDDLDLVGITAAPLETNPVLIVDAYAELPASIATQFLEPVTGWHTQISQVGRGIKHQ
jgi:hypothetical protein